MARHFVVIKRKGSKRPIGAVPIQRGVSLRKVKKRVSKRIKSGFQFKILSEAALTKLLIRLRPISSRSRKSRTTRLRRKPRLRLSRKQLRHLRHMRRMRLRRFRRRR